VVQCLRAISKVAPKNKEYIGNILLMEPLKASVLIGWSGIKRRGDRFYVYPQIYNEKHLRVKKPLAKELINILFGVPL
jgi:hypothetical protein